MEILFLLPFFFMMMEGNLGSYKFKVCFLVIWGWISRLLVYEISKSFTVRLETRSALRFVCYDRTLKIKFARYRYTETPKKSASSNQQNWTTHIFICTYTINIKFKVTLRNRIKPQGSSNLFQASWFHKAKTSRRKKLQSVERSFFLTNIKSKREE